MYFNFMVCWYMKCFVTRVKSAFSLSLSLFVPFNNPMLIYLASMIGPAKCSYKEKGSAKTGGTCIAIAYLMICGMGWGHKAFWFFL